MSLVTDRPAWLRRFSSAVFFLGVASVTVLSILPRQDLPHIHMWDKLEHLAAYVAVAVTGRVAFPGRSSQTSLAIGLIALGGLLEVVQAFVPGRDPSALDATANAFGVGLGLSLIRIVGFVGKRAFGSMREGPNRRESKARVR